jgi:hypothetical protein
VNGFFHPTLVLRNPQTLEEAQLEEPPLQLIAKLFLLEPTAQPKPIVNGIKLPTLVLRKPQTPEEPPHQLNAKILDLKATAWYKLNVNGWLLPALVLRKLQTTEVQLEVQLDQQHQTHQFSA